MEESRKGASSSVNSKEKNSLLDIDFGKDFLSSWKSVAAAEDDPMDFDFGTSVKGKKKIFNFDKLDMDFTLGGDLDKISTFKVDISDLDISSPPKKAGTSKQKSKEEFAGVNNQVKDQFTFPFDFSELDSFSFEKNLGKGDKKSDKIPDSKGVSSQVGNPGCTVIQNENIFAVEDEMAIKLPAPNGVSTSKLETLVSSCGDLDSVDSDSLSKCVTTGRGPSKSATVGSLIKEEGSTTVAEKPNKTATQETDRESSQQTKITLQEQNAHETNQDLSFQSASRDESSQGMASEIPMECCCLSTKVSNSSGLECNVNLDSSASQDSDHVKSPSDSLPPEYISKSLTSNSQTNMPASGNNVLVDNVDETQPAPAHTDSDDTSLTSANRLLQDDKANTEQQNSKSKSPAAPPSSGPTVGKLMQMKEKKTAVIRYDLFMRSVEAEDQPERASTHSKLSSFGIKRTKTLQPSAGGGRRDGVEVKNVEPENSVTRISISHLRELSKGDPSQSACGKSIEVLKGIGSTLKQPSSSKQINQSTRLNGVDPGPPSLSMASAQNPNGNSGEGNRNPTLKARGSIPDLSGLKISRPIGANRHPSTPTFLKGIKSLRETDQNMEVQGNITPKLIHSVGAEKRTTQPPLSLKRKTFEASDGGPLGVSPSKRLSPSPNESRNFKDPPERDIDQEVCKSSATDGTTKKALVACKSSVHEVLIDVKMTDMPLVLEKDDNVEKAEAYTKALEDICNMLKKKHEEGKELLVRAVVNNNYLLMLNHPINDDKIQRVQKFATRLMSKEIQT